MTLTATPQPPTATLTAEPAAALPVGYPLAPDLATDLVVGELGSRVLSAGAGPAVRTYSETLQVSDDPVAANASGWNCRTHVAYEGVPAVDWYVGTGAPISATMDGLASLYVVTTVNSFDYYGVAREPYLGLPDPERASPFPFPGPSGGMGVFVEVAGEAHVAYHGHLDPQATWPVLPAEVAAALPTVAELEASHAVPKAPSERVLLASWQVSRGDVIGAVGDTGYSEAPHLHYAIVDLEAGVYLCPTSEAGFEDGGWLGRVG